MKRILSNAKVLILSVPVVMMMALTIGCGSPEATPEATQEATPEPAPVVIDTLADKTDSIPVDSGAGSKPPVNIIK